MASARRRCRPLHPVQVAANAVLGDIAVHPVPPHAGPGRGRWLAELLEQRVGRGGGGRRDQDQRQRYQAHRSPPAAHIFAFAPDRSPPSRKPRTRHRLAAGVKSRVSATDILSAVMRGTRLFRRDLEQSAGGRVFQRPDRTVGRNLDIAHAVAHIPALGRLGACVPSTTIRLMVMVAMPPIRIEPFHCGKTSALVESDVAGRDDRRPIDHRLGQVGAGVEAGDRHAVIVGGIRTSGQP